MAWTDAARAAAAEARRRRSQGLHQEIARGVGGINKTLTLASLRSAVAGSMVRNRKTFRSMGGLGLADRNKMVYMTANISAKDIKARLMNAMRKLHPKYSKGLSVKKMFPK